MNTMKLPFYAKLPLLLIGLFLLVAILYIGGDIIVPILFSTIIAIVLSPAVDFLERHKINRVVSIFLVVITLLLIALLLLILIASRLSDFLETFPVMMDKFAIMIDNSVNWLSQHFQIRTRNIKVFIEDAKSEIVSNGKRQLGATIASMGSVLVSMVLIPVYVIMIMYYRPLLLDFLKRVFGKNNEQDVIEILGSSKHIIQSYLIGLLLEAAIMAVLNTVGLFSLGIKYAIVLGIIGALLNMIPYLGGIIAVTLFAVVALVTKESSIYALYIVLIYTVIQFIDNNLIVPKLIGSKVKINALMSIIAVIIGGALWGIAGMFLSLPLIAIIKVIFDRIEVLKPWGFLLGDTMPSTPLFRT